MSREYRCGTLARALPRLLAAAALLAGFLVAARFEGVRVPFLPAFRTALVLGAAVAALWILRRGGALRMTFVLDGRRLRQRLGRREVAVELRDLRRIRWAPPLSARSSWVPAVVLVDRSGREVVLPSFVENAPRLLEETIRGADRHDLAAWSRELALPRRLARGRVHIVLGYALAAGLVLGAVSFYLLRVP